MADVIDTASDAQDVIMAAAIGNRVVYFGESALECEECSSDIPEARRLAVPGVQHCVACVQYLERQKALRR